MKVRLNDDREVVKTVREGLKRTGGYCPCRLAGQRRTGVCAGSSRTKSPIRTLKATAIVGCTTKRNKKIGPQARFFYFLLNSRRRPSTVRTTPPSSMESAKFHTSARFLIRRWGNWR